MDNTPTRSSSTIERMFSERSVVDSPFSWIVTIAALICYTIAVGCFQGTTGVFFSAFLKEFQANHSVTAIVSGLTGLSFQGSGILVAKLSARFGSRLVVISGALFMGFSFIITSLSGSLFWIYLSQGLLKGFSICLMLQPLWGVVIDHHYKRRTLAMSIVVCGAGLGSSILAVTSEWLISCVGWRWACRVLGVFFISTGSTAAMAFVPIDLAHVNTPTRSIPLSNRELFKKRTFKYYVLINFLKGCYISGYVTFVTNFAETRNISSAKAAGLWTFWGIATIVGRLWGGLDICKSTPFTRLRDWSLSLVCVGLASWLLAFELENWPNYSTFAIIMTMIGFLDGIFYHLISLCAADLWGDENVDLAMGWFFSSQLPSVVAAPPMLGFVTDQSNGNYIPAFQILAVTNTVAGVIALLFWRSGRQLIQDPEERAPIKVECEVVNTCSTEVDSRETTE